MSHYIITNFKSRGFACSKMCKECNWINHPLLTNTIPSINSIQKFLKTNVSRYINISGGGDPLYDYLNCPENLNLLIDRIITIDPQINITLHTGITDLRYLIKLGNMVNEIVLNVTGSDIHTISHLTILTNLKVSMIYSELCDIESFKKDVVYLNDIFNGKLIINEDIHNLNKIPDNLINEFENVEFKLKKDFYDAKLLIGNNMYLGTDITGDMKDLQHYLFNNSDIFVIGSYLRNFILPDKFKSFNDIDIVISDEKVIVDLIEKFKYRIYDYTDKHKPSYYKLRSHLFKYEVHVVLLQSKSECINYIFDSQLDINRIYLNHNNIHTPLNLSYIDILNKLNNKTAEYKSGLIVNRPLENQYIFKQIRSGFKIQKESK